MIRISKLLLALIACALCAAPALAQDGTLKKIKDNGYITIGHRDASIHFPIMTTNSSRSDSRWTCARKSSMRSKSI